MRRRSPGTRGRRSRGSLEHWEADPAHGRGPDRSPAPSSGGRHLTLLPRLRVPVQAEATMSEEANDGADVDFEAALAELEGLVERMERGELSLDDSLGAFERGIHLTRTCQRALADAEQRVRTLLEREDGTVELGDDDAAERQN